MRPRFPDRCRCMGTLGGAVQQLAPHGFPLPPLCRASTRWWMCSLWEILWWIQNACVVSVSGKRELCFAFMAQSVCAGRSDAESTQRPSVVEK
mmetsp:Transcript_94513/g.252859  ORF Transcript_94513/g.252859 Transcript_94513/m.252859 type:complete len:93 (-) Transcript_94513:12-290(-)